MSLQEDGGFFPTQQIEENDKQNSQRVSPLQKLQFAQTSENDQNKKINNLIQQARYLKDQYAPLSQQNSNLKEYILAMNFYLDQRCKEFGKLLRDLPDRQILKQIGDMATIYELVREDIKYYQNLINGFIITQQKLEEEMKQTKEQEKSTISEYQLKFQNVTSEAEKVKHDIIKQMQDQQKKYDSQIEKFQIEIKKYQSDLSLKVMECNRFNEIIIQQKKMIDKNAEEFRNEILTYENMIKKAKENLKNELRQAKNINDFKIKELVEEHKLKLTDTTKYHEDEINSLKQQIQKVTEDLIHNRKDFERINQKYLRTKGMLEVSQNEMREYMLEKKQILRTTEQLQQLVDHKSEQLRFQDVITQEYNEKIKQLDNQIKSLEIKLLDLQESQKNEVQDYSKLVTNITELLEIDISLQTQEPKLFINMSLQKILEKFKLKSSEEKKFFKELNQLYEENQELKNNFNFNEQYYHRELQNFLFEYNKLIKVTKNIIRKSEQSQLGVHLIKKEQPRLFKKIIKKNYNLFKDIKKKEQRYIELERYVQFSTRQQIKFNLQKNQILDEEIRSALPWYLTEILTDSDVESNSIDDMKKYVGSILQSNELVKKQTFQDDFNSNMSQSSSESSDIILNQNQTQNQQQDKNINQSQNENRNENLKLIVTEKGNQNQNVNEDQIENKNQNENNVLNQKVEENQKDYFQKSFQKQPLQTNPIEQEKVQQVTMEVVQQQINVDFYDAETQTPNLLSNTETQFNKIDKETETFVKTFFQQSQDERIFICSNCQRDLFQNEVNDYSSNHTNYIQLGYQVDAFLFKPNLSRESKTAQYHRVKQNDDSYEQVSSSQKKILKHQWKSQDVEIQTRKSVSNSISRQPSRELAQIREETQQADDQMLGREIEKKQLTDDNFQTFIFDKKSNFSEGFSSPKHEAQTEKNFSHDNQDSELGNSKVVSHRSLHQIVQQIQQMKRDKKTRSSLIKEVQKSHSDFTYDLENNIDSDDKGYMHDTFNKSIQVAVKRKTQWVQTEDVESSEYYKRKYNEIVEEYEKRTKLQVQVLSSREGEKIKEIQQKSQRISDLTQMLEEKEAIIEGLQTHTVALINTKSILEVNLANEIQKSRELQTQITMIEQKLQKKKEGQIESLIKKNQEYQQQVEDLNQELINLKEESANHKIQYENECKYREQDKQKAIIDLQEQKTMHERQLEGIKSINLQLEYKLQDSYQQIDQLKINIENRESRAEDLEYIDQLQKQIEIMQNNMMENFKSMSHANEIVKYLQMELENYKQMYNFFSKEPSEQSAKLNIENIRTTLFGNNYQKQLLKVIEVQSQLLNEQQQRQNNQQQLTVTPQNRFPRKKDDLKKILALPQVKDRNLLNDQADSEHDIFQNNILCKEYGSVGRRRDNSTRKKKNISEILISDSKQPPKTRELLNKLPQKIFKKSKPHSQFCNPMENDNLIFKAEQFIRNLYEDPDPKIAAMSNTFEMNNNFDQKYQTFSKEFSEFKNISTRKWNKRNSEIFDLK